MAVQQRMSEGAYEQFVLSGLDRLWELHDGRLVEKPGMTWEHNRTVMLLNRLLLLQLNLQQYHVFTEGRVRRSTGTIYIPDLAVVPIAFGHELENRPGVLAIFSDPLPLVVEVWSLSTGDYDVATKVPEYQARGDLEIWRVHPYERTVTTWQRRPDGSYVETVHREGVVRPRSLPGVEVDLAALFDEGDAG